MTETTCDQCKKAMVLYTTGFSVRNNERLSMGGIDVVRREPLTLDLCSWRCMEDYARERAA